jgi:hypothetical protein
VGGSRSSNASGAVANAAAAAAAAAAEMTLLESSGPQDLPVYAAVRMND